MHTRRINMKEKQINSKIYKAAIYLRLSKEDEAVGGSSYQSESNSITSQRMLVHKFLESASDIIPKE